MNKKDVVFYEMYPYGYCFKGNLTILIWITNDNERDSFLLDKDKQLVTSSNIEGFSKILGTNFNKQFFLGRTRHPLSAEGGQLRLHAGIFQGIGLGHHRGPGRNRDAVCAGSGQQGGGHIVVVQPGPAEVQEHRRSEERRVGKECRSRWSPYH